MGRQGYLARVTRPYPDEPSTCGYCCASCCGKTNVPAPAIFVLTEIGERLLPCAGLCLKHTEVIITRTAVAMRSLAFLRIRWTGPQDYRHISCEAEPGKKVKLCCLY